MRRVVCAALCAAALHVVPAVAAEPMDRVVELLLTADRFAASGEDRARVLGRLGLFGVRLSVRLIREKSVTDSGALARALTERGVPTPRGTGAWTHTTVARVLARVAA